MAVEDYLPTAILIPSLGRANRLQLVVRNIRETTPEEHLRLFCVCDDESKAALDEIDEWYLDDSDVDDHRYVTRMNRLIYFARDFGAKTVFFGSDDVIHHPTWLTKAITAMETQGKAVIVVNDLRNKNGTQALVRTDYLPRAVFDNSMAAFHPGYGHNFADMEMFLTAIAQNEYGRAIDSWVEHLHPIWPTARRIGWDQTYIDAQNKMDDDEKLFYERSDLIEAHFAVR